MVTGLFTDISKYLSNAKTLNDLPKADFVLNVINLAAIITEPNKVKIILDEVDLYASPSLSQMGIIGYVIYERSTTYGKQLYRAYIKCQWEICRCETKGKGIFTRAVDNWVPQELPWKEVKSRKGIETFRDNATGVEYSGYNGRRVALVEAAKEAAKWRYDFIKGLGSLYE